MTVEEVAVLRDHHTAVGIGDSNDLGVAGAVSFGQFGRVDYVVADRRKCNSKPGGK